MRGTRRTALTVLVLGAIAPAVAAASTSHDGWPSLTGVLLMNKTDASRPLDARAGHDPFGGKDPSYSCDGVHGPGGCIVVAGHATLPVTGTPVDVPAARLLKIGHNKLLGGHGSDTIWAGSQGDVLWADYKPSGQPTTQADELHGGAGKDFIYTGHGRNTITTGGGADVIHAHFGRGSITCDGPGAIVYLSRRSRRAYRLNGCTRVSYKTVGY